MALTNAVFVQDGHIVGGVTPDASSAIGYKEIVGTTCKNPDGYAIGNYFIDSNTGYFYRVTAAIAYGATITSGTNCTRTDVSAVLSELNAEIVNAGTMKYDPTTDKIQLWDGTQWVDWKSAGLLTPTNIIPVMLDNTSPSGSASIYTVSYSDYINIWKNGSRILTNVTLNDALPYSYVAFDDPLNTSNVEFSAYSTEATFGIQYVFDDIYTVKSVMLHTWVITPNSSTARAYFKIYLRDVTNGTWKTVYNDYKSSSSAISMSDVSIPVDEENIDAIRVELANAKGIWSAPIGGIQVYGY